MTITTLLSDSTLSAIRVGGSLDADDCAELDQALRPFEEWTNHLIIDLSPCTYLSSTGIGVLQRTEKRLKEKGGSLYLAGLTPNVFQELDETGLRHAFLAFETFNQAEETVRHQLSMKCPCQSWQIGKQSWKMQPFVSTDNPFLCWKDTGMVSFSKLGFAIGVGTPSSSLEKTPVVFLTTGFIAGFLQPESPQTFLLDRVTQPEKAGVNVKRALSFGNKPSGWLVQEIPDTVTALDLITTLHRNCRTGYHAFVIASFDVSMPSITCGLFLDQLQFDRLQEDCGCFSGIIEMPHLGISVWGARFDLIKLEKPANPVALTDFLKNTLTQTTVKNVRPLRLDDTIRDVQSWIFKATEIVDAAHPSGTGPVKK